MIRAGVSTASRSGRTSRGADVREERTEGGTRAQNADFTGEREKAREKIKIKTITGKNRNQYQHGVPETTVCATSRVRPYGCAGYAARARCADRKNVRVARNTTKKKINKSPQKSLRTHVYRLRVQ